MKKVGILTLYYKTYNFGAQLQAYALQKTIERLGYKCEQIRFKWCREETIEGYENASVDQELFEDFSMSVPHSLKVYDADNIYDCIDDYDVFVCGSDQVWGVERSMPPYKLPFMTMSFVPEDKVKIAYAVSLGGAAAPNKIEEVLKATLGKMDAVSVREKTAVPYIERISGKDVVNVLDPVMLLQREELEKIAGKKKDRNPYIFYYTVGADSNLELLVKKISQDKGMEIEKAGYISGNKIGPQDFVRLIRDAEYIITDSFHATVLSILFHKQFLVTPVDRISTERSRNIRLIDLLELFGLQNRFVTSNAYGASGIKKVLRLLETPINYNTADKKLLKQRRNSIEFLMRNLKIEKKQDDFLKPHEKCSGCGICALRCPEGCITMEKDKLGFVYPVRDEKRCRKCGICRNICNYQYRTSEKTVIRAAALIAKNETVRDNSSSGGAFYEIASYILRSGGIVAGCTFSESYRVEHQICRNIEGLEQFCQSKYVQSNAYETFEELKTELAKGTAVLFAGTPCQTHALTSYIGYVPDNLFLIDLVCGGVTAPGLWDKYLQVKQKDELILDITMRYQYSEYLREEGFPAFAMKLKYLSYEEISPSEEDWFLSTRLSFYRDCCYQCEYKGINRESDITIGDFCGMKSLVPSLYDGKGITLAFVHTKKGEDLLKNSVGTLVQYSLDSVDMKEILKKNVMVAGQMKRKAQHEYLRTLYPAVSMERLYFENKFVDEFVHRENIQKNFYLELIRDELLRKLMKFQHCRLLIEECPDIIGQIYIYGAGKLGKAILPCMKYEPKGFIDGNHMLNNCLGFKVYHLGTEEISDELADGTDKTVIITPVWDIDVISENLILNFPNLNIVSLKKVVGDIWL